MFEYALNVTEENHQISAKCFTLLTTSNEDLVDAILENNAEILHDNFEKVLISKDPIQVNRFAMIIQMIISQGKHSGTDISQYLFELLNFAYNRSVFDLFVSIIDNDSNQSLIQLQEYLNENNFTPALANIIKDIPDDLTVDQNSLIITNLFKLIPHIKQSSVLQKSITESEVEIMFRDFKDPSDSLLTSQFSAIYSSLTDPTLFDVAATHVTRLLEFLEKLPQKPFMSYHEFILLILARVSAHVPAISDRLIGSGFCNKLVKLVREFPKHSNAHLAILSFHKQTFSVESLRNSFYEEFIPLADEMITDENATVEQRAFAWNTLRTAKEEEYNVDEKLSEIAKMKFESICEIADSSYGGELPKQAEVDDIELTQEQLQVFLRFLSGNR